jgi:hypothetical protein
VVSWQVAGIAEAATGDGRPFFISWDPGSALPGQAPVDHPGGPSLLGSLVVAGDAAALGAWLGGGAERTHVVPPGPTGTGVVEVVVAQAAGTVVLHPAALT